MPQAEQTLAAPQRDLGPGEPAPAVVHGWGGGEGARVVRLRPRSLDELRTTLELARARRFQQANYGAIVRGLGRSYGDAAQLSGGLVVDTTHLKGFELDNGRGLVTVRAGVTLGELLAQLVPAGWLVPVLPGTQHVTVGGAIASDIHGKNHGTTGTFGGHVRSLELLLASGELVKLTRDDELFGATLGGMGLTGVITAAELALRPVIGPLLSVDTDRVATLDDALAVLSGPGGSYRVAWLDLLGARPGRGIVSRAEPLCTPQADPDEAARTRGASANVRARLRVPARWPPGVLSPTTVRAFNELRFRQAPRRDRGHTEPLGAHMFPLDKLDAWPRLYGPRGFLQYQLVVPRGAEGVLRAVIDHLRRFRVPCYLAVLKDFGPANEAPLSFPLQGWTLALDLPRGALGLHPALDHCDELVAAAGGRVYLTKDVRLRPSTVGAMYPRLQEWRAVRERADPERLWRSDLALRTGLVEGGG
ncbi:MAG: FAD-binding oxidoreductase [Solirubrobacterales bacterium]|nr:FAD-binding oxidoreductase [Solirubrobacterales bacterium]